MNTSAEILLVLASIYFMESVWRIDGASAIVCGRVLWPSEFWRNGRGFLALVSPLSPLRPAFESSFEPLSFTPDGIVSCSTCCVHTSSWLSSPRNFAAYSSIETLDSDFECQLLVNGSPFTKFHCESLAKKAVADIRKAMELSTKERASFLSRRIDADFYEKPWREQLSGCDRIIKPLGLLGIFQVLAIPSLAAVFFFPFPAKNAIGLLLVSAIIVSSISVCILFWILHSRLQPKAALARVSCIFKMLICPSLQARAIIFASRRAFRGCAPHLAARIAAKDGGKEAIESLLRDLAFPVPVNDSASMRTALAWLRDEWRPRLEKMLRDAGGDPEKALLPPEPQEGCLSYCPRCREQYTVESGICQDCAGLPLLPFPMRH